MLDYFENKQMPISQGVLCQRPESRKDPAIPPLPASSFLVCVNVWNSLFLWPTERIPVEGRSGAHVCNLHHPSRDAGAGLGDMTTQEETWFLSCSQVPDVEMSPSCPCTCHLPIHQGSWAHLSLPRDEGHIGGPVTVPALVSDKPLVLRTS